MMILEVAVGALALAGVALGSQFVINKPNNIPQMSIATAIVDTNDDFGNRPGPGGQHLPTLADLLTLENSASIFFSYAREGAETSELLSQPNATPLTVLVPTNKAVMALSHKPHQQHNHVEIGISEEDADKQSRENVRRWVSAHFIPGVLDFNQHGPHATMLEGKSVKFKPSGDLDGPEWAHWLLSPHTPITGMRQASNGVLYFIDGTVEI